MGVGLSYERGTPVSPKRHTQNAKRRAGDARGPGAEHLDGPHPGQVSVGNPLCSYGISYRRACELSIHFRIIVLVI